MTRVEGADRRGIWWWHHVAIDFSLDFERQPNPKGDRVKITMSGKFLPYKYYGAEQGIPEYGSKEAP